MSVTAIHVDRLGKQYRICGRQPSYSTLRDWLSEMSRLPSRVVGKALQKQHLTASRDTEMWALKDVSFQVLPGEIVGVIGRNGAGKSTLLKILSRITQPTQGYAEIRGKIGSMLEVGTGFHPELSGRENIFLNGAILGMTRAEIATRFDDIVEFAEVSRYIDVPVKRYSTGMYLRLAFAVAAHLNPDILLVDEVLAVGDAGFQKRCLGKMGEVARGGRTVLFVSHNMSSIASLTNRCIVLANGQIAQDGATGEVIRRYLAECVAASSRITWEHDRPGDETFEFIACSVGSADCSEEFASEDPISVALQFRVKHRTECLRVGFDLVSQEGVLVFRTYHDDGVHPPSAMEPGVYHSSCVIPGALLNEGEYYMTLRAGIQGVRRIVALEQVLQFSVVNLTGPNARYSAKRPGVLNPALDWSTSLTTEAAS
jgi:lipopolysaccharide transport system ATP-binding protein